MGLEERATQCSHSFVLKALRASTATLLFCKAVIEDYGVWQTLLQC